MPILLVTADYRTLVSAAGRAVWVEEDSGVELSAQRRELSEVAAVAEAMGASVASIRSVSGDPQVARAVHLLRFRETHRFHPATGEPLTHSETLGAAQGGHVFPRIDPAVIGIVELAGQDKILLGRNRQRSGYFSLVAGFVAPGETLEACFAREVLEETGRRVTDLIYRGSQPWPMSGSLMMAFHGVTHDVDAIQATDGELEEIRWVSRAELAEIPLAAPGSIARTLIDEWGSRK